MMALESEESELESWARAMARLMGVKRVRRWVREWLRCILLFVEEVGGFRMEEDGAVLN